MCKFVRPKDKVVAGASCKNRRFEVLDWAARSGTNLHVGAQDFFIRSRLPNYVACNTVNFGERVQRHERHIFHQNAARLLQDSDALLWITAFLLCVDKPVEFGILVLDSLAAARAEILIVHGVGIGGRPPNIVEGQLAAVHAILAPENDKLLRDQLGFNTDFEKLIGDNLTNLARFWITIRRKIELYLEALCIAGFREKLLGFLGIVRIARNFGVIPNDVRSEERRVGQECRSGYDRQH